MMNVEDPKSDGKSFTGDPSEDNEEAGAALVDGIENEEDPCGEMDGDSVPLFFVMDCEASSGVPYRDDIVEIALKCWPYRDNVEDSLFYSLIHTSKYLCKFAKQHGFSKKLLKNQPTFKVVMNKLLDWIKKSVSTASQYMNLSLFPVLLCHGGEGFDYLLLFSQLERTGISFQRLEELNLHFADTFPYLEMYQTAKHPLLVNCGSLGINNLIQQWFGPHNDKAFHRAQNDAEETLRLFSQTPLFGFLQDIPIYTTAEWIEYFEYKKYANKIKRELEENLPASISGAQRKFTIRLLVRNGLDLDSLKALYRECTEPHHFRQELVDLSMKGVTASKLMTHFYSKGIHQVGTKEYAVKLKENMQPQEWTCQTNARGRKFSRHVANVLPPIFPLGGSGFNFDDATEASQAEGLKDIMESFTKFQLQLSSSAMTCGDQKCWNLPPEFWNSIDLSAERIYTVDENTYLPEWQDPEQDWQCETVDDFGREALPPTPFGGREPPPPLLPTPLDARAPSAPLLPMPLCAREPPAPLLPTPLGAREAPSPLLPTPTGAREAPSPLLPIPLGARQPFASFSYDSDEIRHRPLVPCDQIRQESVSAEYKNQKQFIKLKKGRHMQQNSEIRKKNNRRGRSQHQQQQANNCGQKYPSKDSILHVKSGHSFEKVFSGHTAQINGGHIAKANEGDTAKSNEGHTAQAIDGHTARANDGHTAQINGDHTAQYNDGQPAWDNDGHTVQTNNDHTAQDNNGHTGQANDGNTAQINESNTAQDNGGQTAQANGSHTAQDVDNQFVEQGARRKTYKCKPCENKKQGNDFRYKHGNDGYTNEHQDFKETNNWKGKKSSRYRKTPSDRNNNKYSNGDK
ncbi:uncharacterized protein LOC117101829 [Anneissia japonica]|uniref:uncharacterized protein LOC117101829 n=1 Tax=Anneissia japonica TaxID=1529436 RepID=UPI00142598AE|nr:uncharacterized protein LOC117101829 [Anneissia japonica]